jgi:hypothetical protein
MVFWQAAGKRHGLQSREKVSGAIGRKTMKRIEAFSITPRETREETGNSR